jgi:hypothetical protein
VLFPQEDGADRFTDEQLLDRASQLGRPLMTHDIRFKAMAEDWQRQNRPFCGLIFGHQMRGATRACSLAPPRLLSLPLKGDPSRKAHALLSANTWYEGLSADAGRRQELWWQFLLGGGCEGAGTAAC